MLIQTEALNGAVNVASTPANQEFFVQTNNVNDSTRCTVALTPEQAADLLESFVSMGVRLTDKTREMLDIPANVY